MSTDTANTANAANAANTANAAYGPRFDKALALAHELHRTQVRKGTAVPYVTHLLAVAALAAEAGGDEDEVIAALLHDAVEDQGGPATLERIRAELGDDVASIVKGCSDTDEVPKPPWRERKQAYVAHLQTAPKSVLLVSAADKVHNARSIVADLRTGPGHDLWDRFKGGREGTLWYYRAVLTVLESRNALPRLVDALSREVTEMERLAALPDPRTTG